MRRDSDLVDAIRDNSTIDVLNDDDFIVNDIWLNRAETPTTRIYGQTSNIVAGLSIEIIVSDASGNTVTLNTTTDGSGYSVENVDLTSLDENTLSVVATVSDNYGR